MRARLSPHSQDRADRRLLPEHGGCAGDARRADEGLGLERCRSLAAGAAAGRAPTPGCSAGSGRPGRALLANDPHLGLEAPGAWYLATWRSPGLRWSARPCRPADRSCWPQRGLAWGLTNTGADARTCSSSGRSRRSGRYLTPAERAVRRPPGDDQGRGRRRYDQRARDPARARALGSGGRCGHDLRRRRALALAWTGLADDDLTADALWRWIRRGTGRASSSGPARSARRAEHPLRRPRGPHRLHRARTGADPPPGDGRWPVPGWSGEYDWQGGSPSTPCRGRWTRTSGQIVNANNRVVGPAYPYL